jgi:hypothetical protein
MRKCFKWGVRILTVSVLGLAGAMPLFSAEGPGPWNMGYSISFVQPTGDSANVLEDGMGLNFNFGYQKPKDLVGFRVDVLYAGAKLQQAVIDRLDQASEGNFKLFGGGASVVLSPRNYKHLKPTLYAGPGLYYEHAQATWDQGCDPLFGCPAGGGQYNTSTLNTTRLGYQGGASLEFQFDEGLGALSLDVQFIHVNNTNGATELMPINVGYKVMF